MDQIYIQVQDVGGNWLTTQVTSTNHDQYVRSLMKQAQQGHPGKRVRAIDADERVIDILN